MNLDLDTAAAEWLAAKEAEREFVKRRRAQEVAMEHGLADSLSHLFRWKAEINIAAWKATMPEITDRFAKCVTTKPSRASFSIEKE